MEIINCVVGVDVGDTNTDAVLLQENPHGQNILSSAKTSTTADITSGIQAAVRLAINNVPPEHPGPLAVSKVNIGTTHLISALVEAKGLSKVSVIRLCGSASRKLPPFSDFPDHNASGIKGSIFLVKGGYQFDGKEIDSMDEAEIIRCAEKLKRLGERNIVVSGIYSPNKSDQEDQVVEIIARVFPDASVSASHKVGKLGLLQRENAAIVNETLKGVFRDAGKNIKAALEEIGVICPIFITQNDGTTISVEEMCEFPIKGVGSSISNCLKGASFLSCLTSFVCVDIGGSTTDVATFLNGKPKECSAEVIIGGIRMNCKMPDVITAVIGGGSYVKQTNDASGNTEVSVGPESSGCDIENEALVFAKGPGDIDGRKITATDIAVSSGNVAVPKMKKENTHGLSDEIITKAIQIINEKFTGLIDQARTDGNEIPVVVTGGANILLTNDTKIRGVSEIIIPRHADVAAAIGASLATTNKTDETNKPCIIDMARIRQITAGSALGTPVKQTYTQKGNALRGPTIDIKPEEPTIDQKTGEWLLSEYDIECISIGAGIMGCGGGGNPTIGKLMSLNLLRENKTIRVVNPSRFLNKAHPENDIIVTVAFMGAPSTVYEKLVSGNETIDALRSVEQLLQVGENAYTTCQSGDDAIVEEKNGVRCIDNFKLNEVEKKSDYVKNKKVVGLLCTEVGGMNSIEPLVVGATLGLPVLDCDGMGRAFPEIQMFAPFMYGSTPYPAAIADEKGRRAVVLHAEGPKQLENYLRDTVVSMGCVAGVVLSYFNKEEILTRTVPNSMSHAWRIGDTILRARNSNVSPVNALIDSENGKLLISGTITDIQRQATDGFNKGRLFIHGLHAGHTCVVSIDLQNEYLVAQIPETNEILATIPDLLTIVDATTAQPIPSEELKIGMGVAVVVFPAPPLITTDLALQFVGPQAFGYPESIKYKPIGEFVETKPVCPL